MANKTQSALSGAGQGAATGFAVGGPIGGLIGGGIGLLGGLFGGGKSEAEKAAEQAVADLEQNYGVEPIEARRVVYEKFKEIGALTPEMEQAILAGPTAQEQVTTDPRFKQTQLEALSRLERKMAEGGLDLEDRANLAAIQQQEAQAARGREEAILQNMAQRGMGGAGAELAARLANSQAAADQAATRGLSVAAQAQKRAAENIAQAANQARTMQQDELIRAENLAAARDSAERFNVGQRSNVQQRNVGAKNRAQELNTDYQREIAAKNTGITNQQRLDDRAAQLGYTDAKNARLAAIANARNAQAVQADQSAAANAQGWSNTLAGLGSAVIKGKEAGLFGDDKKKV